jgi:hypothetical protein
LIGKNGMGTKSFFELKIFEKGINHYDTAPRVGAI